MRDGLAHVTLGDTPTGLLLFIAGVVVGCFATLWIRRYRTH
ncbi:MAG: hypothetical protein ACR2NM_14415 [Bythopirellula sp.]